VWLLTPLAVQGHGRLSPLEAITAATRNSANCRGISDVAALYTMDSPPTELFAGPALGPLLGGIVSDIFGHRQALVVTGIVLVNGLSFAFNQDCIEGRGVQI